MLLVEVEGRQGISQTFDVTAARRQTEARISHAENGGEVFGLAVEAKAALLEYLQMFYKLGRAGGLLEKFGAVDFATTIAPGVRDVLLTGKVYEAVRRRRDPKAQGPRARPAYDAVVLDAPPTGRVVRFLNVNHEVAGVAKVGPIRSQADSITAMMQSPQTVVHVVTLLEEMPVQETVDAIGELRKAGFGIGGVVVNQVREPLLPAPALAAAAGSGIDAGEVTADLEAVGMRGRRRAGAGPADPGARPRRAGEPGADARSRPCSRWGARPTGCRTCPTASTPTRSASSPSCSPTRGWPEWHARRRPAAAARAPKAPPLDIDDLIGDPGTRIIVCCGSGGVGKTTTAAAIGRARRRGRPQGRRAHHRPRAAAGAVPRPHRARQRAPPGDRHRPRRPAAPSTR